MAPNTVYCWGRHASATGRRSDLMQLEEILPTGIWLELQGIDLGLSEVRPPKSMDHGSEALTANRIRNMTH
jgi:hypothetical protein